MKNIKVGTLVKPIENTNSHNYTLNKTYEVCSVYEGENPYVICHKEGGIKGNCLLFDDLEVVCVTREDLANQILDLENQMTDIRAKIDKTNSIINWMNETGAVEYDENEHKVWEALTLLESNSLSKIEKTKLIANLLK